MKLNKLSLVLLATTLTGLSACNSGGANSQDSTAQTANQSSSLDSSNQASNNAGIALPYVQINVDELDDFSWTSYHVPSPTPSIDTSSPVSSLGSYFPTESDGTQATSYSLSGNKLIQNYLTFGSGSAASQLFQQTPLTESGFAALSASQGCSILDGDKNKVACNLTVTANGGLNGSTGSLPVILYRGLRAYNVAEMIRDLPAYDSVAARPNRWDKDNSVVNKSQPYYMEISATPSDFNTSTTIVDLHNYFYSPDGNEGFSFDASQLNNGNATTCNIVKITGVDSQVKANPVSCSDSQFSINQAGYLSATGLTAGVYQINVKASEPSGSVVENAWQTFYLNVAATNPDLAAWKTGSVATNNVLGDFNSIYVYSSQDPDKPNSGWPTDLQSYGKDLKQINNNYLNQRPIKTALTEMIDMGYTYSEAGMPKIGYWKLDTSTSNPESQITAAGVTTNRPDPEFAKWIGTVLDPSSGAFASNNVGFTLSYAFDNDVKADLIGYNDKQQDLLADALVHPVLYASQLNSSYKIDGLAMDLEGGFTQTRAAEVFKKVADRLAYHGKWFTFFYFSSGFTPVTSAAFGPLGVANFSTYDVATYRAPLNQTPDEISYVDNTFGGAFASEYANALYAAFKSDTACNTTVNGVTTVTSWCNSTLNDSVSENYRMFNETYHTVSPSDAMTYFDGKYAPVLPLATSATQWSQVEIWTPDFTKHTKPGEVSEIMLNQPACNGLTNAFFAANESALSSPGSQAYNQLASCVMQNVNIESVPLQTFSHCGNNASGQPIPYAQCIMVSGLPGKGSNDASINHPDALAYAENNYGVYASTKANQAGYAVYALQNPGTATQGAFGETSGSNLNVQEPWYIGFNYSGTRYDPAYNAQSNTNEWSKFGAFINAQ